MTGLLAIGFVLAWGLFVRAQRDLVRSLQEQLEQDQRLRLEQARESERLRIAREMHDALALRVSLLSPAGARIIAVCDALYSMTSPRPYREPMSRADALAELSRRAGTQFDPVVVELCCGLEGAGALAAQAGRSGSASVPPATSSARGQAARCVTSSRQASTPRGW